MIHSTDNDAVKQPLLQDSKQGCSHYHYDSNFVAISPSSPWTRPARSNLRPKFLLAGFLFGSLMEFLYVYCIRRGYAELQHTAPSVYSIRIEASTDILFYEMAFLYSDVMFVLYVVILVRNAMSRKLSLNLAIQAANWTVGMILGLSAAASTVVGTQMLLQHRGLEILGSLVVGILLCLVAYATAVEIQEQCLFPQTEDANDDEVRDSTFVLAQTV